MDIIYGLIALVLVLGSVYAVVTFIGFYVSAAPGLTLWERLIYAAGNSATKLVARGLLVLSSASGVIIYVADFVGHPEFDGPIRAILSPNLVPLYGVVTAVIVIIARNRTLRR